MSDKPESPAVLKYVEFETTGEEYWAVDRYDRLKEDFAVEVVDLPEWHAVMVGQGMAWELARRLYQAGSLTNPDDDVLRPWNRQELAKKFSIPKGQVDMELENAVKHWKLKHARREVARQADSGVDDDEITKLTAFSNGGGIEKDTVDRLLEAYNFAVKDENLRAQVAKRILSLKDYLASPHTRTSAREIIRMEITMHGLEKILVGYQNQIERLSDEDPERRSRGAEIDELSRKAKDLDQEIRKIGVDHAKKQVAIGADDIDMTTRKRIFVETVAYIQEMCREYESDPANVLVDGVFTAGEIDWLMGPLGERKAQYRPDISVRLRDALLPENLWDPVYEPPKISIRVCQELAKLVEGMRAVPEDGEPLAQDDEDDDDDGSMGPEVADVPLEEDGVDHPAPAAPVFGPRSSGVVMGVY